ncbi:MAG TPA: UPF0175 family protein [Candidatus Sericytochromatia bacterium]
MITQEIAIASFQQERITLGRVSAMTGINQIEFQQLLASRGICIHYDLALLLWRLLSWERPWSHL